MQHHENIPIVRVRDEEASVGRHALRGLLSGVDGILLEVGDLGGLAGHGSERFFDGTDGGRHGEEMGGSRVAKSVPWQPVQLYTLSQKAKDDLRERVRTTSLADHSDERPSAKGRRVCPGIAQTDAS